MLLTNSLATWDFGRMDKRNVQQEQRVKAGEETNFFFKDYCCPANLWKRINLSLSLQMSLKAIISNHKKEEFKDVSCNAEGKSPPVCNSVFSTESFAPLMYEVQVFFAGFTNLNTRTISFSGMNCHICALR